MLIPSSPPPLRAISTGRYRMDLPAAGPLRRRRCTLVVAVVFKRTAHETKCLHLRRRLLAHASNALDGAFPPLAALPSETPPARRPVTDDETRGQRSRDGEANARESCKATIAELSASIDKPVGAHRKAQHCDGPRGAAKTAMRTPARAAQPQCAASFCCSSSAVRSTECRREWLARGMAER